MFLNHTAAFDTHAPVTTRDKALHPLTLSADALVETEAGWHSAGALRAGVRVATLDGGFAALRAVERAPDAPLIRVPGGTLSACSDVLLPASTHIGLDLPAHLSQAPVASVPLQALTGWRGIRPAAPPHAPCVTLFVPGEEMVYVQTGLRVHSATHDPFFTRKTYGETRALLALLDGSLPAPDRAIAA